MAGVQVSLEVAPKSGFLMEWHSCLGLYDRNYGAIKQDDDRIRLEFTFDNPKHIVPAELIPVGWGISVI